MLSCSPESNYKSKVKGKASGFPHMVGLSFIGKCISKLISGIDAVSVNNVIKLYHYLNGSFFCFQALTAFCTAYDCLPMFTE